MSTISAMVLAGGKGTRMDILCQARAKPVLPFAGAYRVIDFSLSNCVNSGILDISILVDHQRQCVSNYLENSSFVDKCQGRLRILEPGTGSYSGTADAVFQNLGHVGRVVSDAVLVLAGDHVYRMDYRKMLAFHEQTGADVTIGVIPVPLSEACRFGIVQTDSQGRILEFVEKPPIPSGNLASMGIYIFNRSVLVRKLTEDSARESSAHDFGRSIIPGMLKAFNVFAYRFSGYWQDIGTIESYYHANLDLNRETTGLFLNGSWPIHSGAGQTLVNAETQPGVRNSRIGAGCDIQGTVENSILFPGVRVERQATVRNSIVMADTVVGWHSVVDRCIVDEGSTIGKSCFLGFGVGVACQNHGITVIGKGVNVPDYTATDRNCRIGPYATPAGFKTNAVLTGTVMCRQAVTAS